MPTLEFKGKQYIYSHHHSVPFRELLVESKKSLPASGKKPSLDDNLIIHGDNLHALKALMPQYAGKINCIYIDPPYNTGNEGWCYNDNVNSPLMKEWLKKNANPVDKEDMQRHDKWLCMMYPRLKLLHELLADDGVIFVSIDDNEVHHLRAMMDEIFGETNIIACVANISNPKGRSDDANIAMAHEYVVIYKKTDASKIYGWKPDETIVKRYNKKDADGVYREIDLRKTGENDLKEDRENLFYYFLYDKKTKDFYPTRDEEIPKGYIQIKPLRGDGREGNWRQGLETTKASLLLEPKYMPNRKVWTVMERDYLNKREYIKAKSAWTEKKFNSERGTEQFINLGFDKKDFSKPKPIGLIKAILELSTDKNSIILDSFAGSGTTAHAVLDLNKEDGGNRKFILVEMEDYADSVTAERVRRVINGVPTAKDEKLKAGLDGSFTFCELGKEISIEKIITGESLPEYDALAKYVFYTATGKSLDGKAKEKMDFFVGETDLYEVYLIYKPDIAFLRGNDSALNDLKLKAIASRNSKKEKLVFATAKYMGQKELSEQHITFCQLPYAIHKVVGA